MVTIKSKQLKSALKIIRRVTNDHKLMPILSNVLMAVKGDKLLITATDMETIIKQEISVTSTCNETFLINAEVLDKILAKNSSMGDDVVQIAKDGKRIAITTLYASYSLSKLQNESDYPDITHAFKEEESAVVPASILKHFVVTKDPKQTIGDKFKESIVFKGGEIYTTDGHQIFSYNTICNIDAKLPIVGALVLANVMGDSDKIYFSRTFFNFKSADGKLEIFIRANENDVGSVNINALFKLEDKTKITLARTDLIAALERMKIVDPNKTVIKISGSALELSAENPDLGTGTEEIMANIEGEDVVLTTNPQYFINGLNAYNTEEITFYVGNDQRHPALIEGEGIRFAFARIYAESESDNDNS